jgi:hypothetical protein
MIEKCYFEKASKVNKFMPGLAQIIRAYKTYPNCDVKRVGPCNLKTLKNTQKA